MDDYGRQLNAMWTSIREAGLSVPEDARPHPKVGAVLVDSGGEVLLRAHRGNGCNGDHAEFNLLREAERLGVSLSGKSLYVTLEPCVHRGPQKTPCYERIVASGIQYVTFGMLDPNPRNRGKAEILLRRAGLVVNRFPHDLICAIEAQNALFVSSFSGDFEPHVLALA